MEDPDSEALTLLKMPDDAMRKILEKLDYCGIQTLRKTCHSLRNFIDDVKPDLGAISFNLSMMSYQIIFTVNFSNYELSFSYRDEYGDCQLLRRLESEPESKYVLVKNRNHVDVFLDDFKVLLKFIEPQQHPMEWISFLNWSKRKSNFFEVIEKLDTVLKVDKVHLTVYGESEARALLNLTTPGCLKTIGIEYSGREKCLLRMTEVPNMEHWRQAENVKIEKYDVRSPQHFWNFRNVEAHFVNLSPYVANLMKETFRNSPNFESFKYHFSDLRDGVFDAFGPNPAVVKDELYGLKVIWYFKNPGNPQKVLVIEFTPEYKSLSFTMGNLSDVPSDVEILD